VRRLAESLPFILESIPEEEREEIAFKFNSVAHTPLGIYVLADYVNFKGLGIVKSESYNGKGWGLLQVLEGMQDGYTGQDAVREFVRSANDVLVGRVRNSPRVRNEDKWLPGWLKRVKLYLPDS